MTRACKLTRHVPARDGGYVLVEVLVSLAILALLLSLLPGMLRLGSRATESARAIEGAQASEAALSLLRRTIEGALPFYETDAQGAFGIAFRGEQDAFEMIGEMPGPRGGGLAIRPVDVAHGGDAEVLGVADLGELAEVVPHAGAGANQSNVDAVASGEEQAARGHETAAGGQESMVRHGKLGVFTLLAISGPRRCSAQSQMHATA